jgi:hypothetical protein
VALNIFVLSTGRCGSTTFANACRHIENYSSAHESRARRVGDSRFEFPENHIESDNRLSWLLGRLDDKFGKNAFYVHLRRDDAKTVESFVKRYDQGIVAAYRNSVLMGPENNDDPYAISLDYIQSINANIRQFLRDKPLQMNFRLESAADDFRVFWDRIGAKGDFDRAVSEFQNKYNASTSKENLIRRALSAAYRFVFD